jgi:hypothetical protein
MSDDEILDGEDMESEILGVPEIVGDEIDEDGLELDEGFAEDDLGTDDLADEVVVDVDITTDIAAPGTGARKQVAEDDDDDDDLRTEDDVEADLDAILREKLTAADETPLEDDEEDVVDDDKTDGMERLQPRRPDEIQCAQCFLLVRKSAPGCPVEDDACPLFVR